jgi:hypothetical protein
VTIRSRSMSVVDLIHEFPYRISGIGVTRDLESLHRELPVHETPKRSGPLDPNHCGSLDLVKELVYRSSRNGVTSGLGRCISNSQLLKSRYDKDHWIRGRFATVDLIEGKILKFRVCRGKVTTVRFSLESRKPKAQADRWHIPE